MNPIVKFLRYALFALALVLLLGAIYSTCSKEKTEQKQTPPPAATTTQPAPNPKTNTDLNGADIPSYLPERDKRVYQYLGEVDVPTETYFTDRHTSYYFDAQGYDICVKFPGLETICTDDRDYKLVSGKPTQKRQSGDTMIAWANSDDAKKISRIRVYTYVKK